MSRRTFANVEYGRKKKQTRREKFLGRMEELIPWERLEGRIRPYYPQAGRGLRQLAAGSAAEQRKAAVWAKVEHPFLYVKRRFGYAKVRYRGLANLLIAERYATA